MIYDIPWIPAPAEDRWGPHQVINRRSRGMIQLVLDPKCISCGFNMFKPDDSDGIQLLQLFNA